MIIQTDPEEFRRFHELLIENNPEYDPFYFPLTPEGKDPLPGQSWKLNRKTFEEAYKLMQSGFNIGIAATDHDRLVIVDADDLTAVGEQKSTLCIQSRKRIGKHSFYFTDDPLSRGVLDSSAKKNVATEHAGEVRAIWQYTVCAGSYVPCSPEEIERIPIKDRGNAGHYTVQNAASVSTITYDELPEIYRVTVEKKRSTEIAASVRKGTQKQTHATDTDQKNKSAMWNLDIHDVTGISNALGKRFEMCSELHGSETGKNASVSDDLLHCWRHNVSHNALTFLAVAAGVSTCSAAGFPHGGGSSGVDMTNPYTQFTIWKYAKDNGITPKDDPIPTQALIHYALTKGLCKEENITDGWKLPAEIYNSVIDACEAEGIDTGREKLKPSKGEGKRKKKGDNEDNDEIEMPFNEVGDRIRAEHHIFTMRDTKEIFLYKKGVYSSKGTELILSKLIREKFKYLFRMQWDEMYPDSEPDKVPAARAGYVNEVLEYIRAYTSIDRLDIENDQEQYINFKNGLFDLVEWKFINHDPEIRLIAQMPVNYDPNAQCPEIQKYFQTCQLPAESVTVLLEFAGYCLTTDVKMQKAAMLYGKGSNGKSVYINLLKTILGQDYTSGESLQKLEIDKYRVANLYGKRLNAFPDLKDTPLQTNEVFNTLTGNDMWLTGERKYQNPFMFRPACKLLFSANKIPFAYSDNYAYYRRWILIEFPHIFEGSEINENLLEILTTEEEKSGFVNLMLTGLQRLLQNRKFSYSLGVNEIEKQYMLHSDNVTVFEEECLRDCSGNEQPTEKGQVYKDYQTWCTLNNLTPVKPKSFTAKLGKIGRRVHNTTKWNGTSSVHWSCYWNTIVDFNAAVPIKGRQLNNFFH